MEAGPSSAASKGPTAPNGKPPIPAASLILLRDGPGLQVLAGLRPAAAPAFPGVVVCPGGKIDPGDHHPVWASRLCPCGPSPLAAAVAAVRETFEETGVLLARRADSGPPTVSRGDLATARAAVASGERAFADLLEGWALRLDGTALVPFSRWITPTDRPYRFDTWFFVAEAPEPDAALMQTWEFASLAWQDVETLLAGPDPLLPPTRGNLERLVGRRSAAEAVAAAREALEAGPIAPITPPEGAWR
jgi:8-oxo-dGTP pyrophosphatase MutT (NUDIX family)